MSCHFFTLKLDNGLTLNKKTVIFVVMKGLTKCQQAVLMYLQDHHRTHGYWPSMREIQKFFKYRSLNSVLGHIKALETKGYMARIQGQARAYRPMSKKMVKPPKQAIAVGEVPVYGQIAAGYPDGVEPTGEIGLIQVDAQTLSSMRKPFAIKVVGDSMVDAGIFDGDTVIVDPCPPRQGDIVAALIDGETTLKRLIHKNGKAHLKAENKRYPLLFPVTQLMIQGVARSVVRSLG